MNDINSTSPSTDFNTVAKQAELADAALDKQEIRTAEAQTDRYHEQLAQEEILADQPTAARSKDSQLAAILAKNLRT